jgi:transcriptional regulator with XRE-family HTH domain
MTDERLIRLVARRVQQLRNAKDLTQEDMQDFGFSYRYYQRIEAAEENLTLKTLNRLAKAFGVEPESLLKFERDK